jgi:hypothetical protein
MAGTSQVHLYIVRTEWYLVCVRNGLLQATRQYEKCGLARISHSPADPSRSVPVSNHSPDAGLSLNARGEFQA